MRTFLMIAGLAGLLASSSAAFAAGGPGHVNPNGANPNGADRSQTVIADNDRANNWDHANNWDRSNRWDHQDNRRWSNPRDRDQFNHNPGWQNPSHHRPGATFNHEEHKLLPKRAIHARLLHQQFRDVGDWHFKNGFYRVSAEDRYGHDVKLIVNAYTGHVVKVHRD
jgi:hypothetical protein